MQKRLVLLLAVVLVIYGCSGNGEKTAAERLVEGDYEDTTTDHRVPTDYNSLDQNIDVLISAGNMIGARHYDGLEASVDVLEKNGEDVSVLRQKLAKLNVAPRQGDEEADEDFFPEELTLDEEINKKEVNVEEETSIIEQLDEERKKEQPKEDPEKKGCSGTGPIQLHLQLYTGNSLIHILLNHPQH